MHPNVTVIIPTYNYANFIMEAIQSVLNQTYPLTKIEIIVLDDGSTDNTKDVLQSLIEKDVISYYYQENKGKACATRDAIKRSTGDFIFNLDADDYFLPGKIEESIKIYEADNQVIHVASGAKIYYQDSNLIDIENIPNDLLGKAINGMYLLKRFYTDNMLFGGGSTYSARTSILKSITIPDEVDMYIDEFLLLAILPFGKSFFLENQHSVWRVHKSNYSGTNSSSSQINKTKRLSASSKAVLAYLKQNNFDIELLKIYEVQDATRNIAYKESLGSKSIRDIYNYAIHVFFEIKPRWKIIRNYYVINRLFPMSLFRILKRIKNVINT